MAEEIDISKLHGIIKQYALAVDKDKSGSKGHGKLNTQQELKLFKEMVIRNGKQAELKRQLPNIKGVSVPVKETTDNKKLNKQILDLMKSEDTKENKQELQKTVSKKLK